ncbi:MAG: hypothetical protein IJE04_00890 [Bacilli bacterium]|nr:hypothetical protein [Bacilli bacterium]
MDIAQNVKELIEEAVKENGYIIDEVLYVKEDGNYFLRVVIDKNGVIDVEDCVVVTRLIDPMLDTIDYITDSYILDVCSKEKGCEEDE